MVPMDTRWIHTGVGLVTAIHVAAAAETTILPELTVTGTASEAPARTAQPLDPAFGPGASTVGSVDLRPGRGFRELLGSVPGVWAASAQGGELSKVSIRGSGIQSDETLGVNVLLDGLSYNQGDGEANLEEFPPSLIERVVVHRGGHAQRDTGLVLGGAIDLVSRTGRSSPGALLDLQAGAFGRRSAEIGGGHARGGWDVFGVAAHRVSDSHRSHGAERIRNLAGNVGSTFGTDGEQRLHLAWSEWRREVAGTLSLEEWRQDPRQADENAVNGDHRIETRSWRVAHQAGWGATGRRLQTGVFLHRRDFLIVDTYEEDYRLGATDAWSDNVGGRLVWEGTTTLGGWRHAIVAGLAAVHETEVSENVAHVGGRLDRGERTAAGRTRGMNLPVFVEDRVRLGERWQLDAGLQFVHVTRRFEDRFHTDAAGDASAHQRFSTTNPKLGLLYDSGHGFVLFGNVHRSWQPPSFDDLTPFSEGPDGGVVYHPLRPQKSWTGELGGRGSAGPVRWEATVYASRVRDELLEVSDPAGRDLGTVNARRTRRRGVELALQAGPDAGEPGWYGHLAYTLNDFRFEDDVAHGDNRIAGVPVHLASFRVGYRAASGLSGALAVESSLSRYPADQANTVHVPAHATLGIALGWRFAPAWELFAEVRNLTNARHIAMVEPVADLRQGDEARIFSPAEGRAWHVAVRWSPR